VFDAFVSYRHVQADRGWARWIQRELETYRIPRSVPAENHPKRRLRRVFRDEDELVTVPDLSEEIKANLRRARFLVVVCSPRTAASEWIDAEIAYFASLGRAERIIPLLVEGEPRDVFPSALRHLHDMVGGDFGTEPLAADVRPLVGESLRERKRMAKLRIAARVIGCRFDELRRREQQRRIRRLRLAATGLAGLAAILLLATVLVIGLARVANANADQSRRRLVASLVESGARAENTGDVDRALVYFAEALQGDSAATPGAGGRWIDRLLARSRQTGTTARLAAQDSMVRMRFTAALQLFPTLVRVIPPGTGLVVAELSPDGRCLLTGSDSTPPSVWNVKTGARCVQFPTADAPAKTAMVRYDSGGTRFLTKDPRGYVRVWDARSGHPVSPVIRARSSETLPEWTDLTLDGRRILLPVKFGEEVFAALVDVRSGDTVRVFGTRGSGSDVSFAAISPDGGSVVTSESSGLHRLWSVSTGEPRGAPLADHDFTGDEGSPPILTHAEFDATSTYLVTASWGGSGRVWRVSDASPVTPPLLHTRLIEGVPGEYAVYHAAFSPSGDRVVTAGDDGTARVWNARTGALVCQTERSDPDGEMLFADFSPGGDRISTAGLAGARVWDASTCVPETPSLRHSGPLESARFGRDDRTLITTGPRSAVRVWDVPRDPLTPFTPGARHSQPGYTLLGPRLVEYGTGILAVWDAERRTARALPVEPGRTITAVALSRDGARLAASDSLGQITVWNAVTRQPVSRDRIHIAGPGGQPPDARPLLRISPDGRGLVAGFPGALSLWETSSGRRLAVLEGAVAVAFGSDSRALFSRSVAKELDYGPDGLQVLPPRTAYAVEARDARTGTPIPLRLARTGGSVTLGAPPPGFVYVNRLLEEVSYSPQRGWTAEALNGQVGLFDQLREGTRAGVIAAQGAMADPRSFVRSAFLSPDGTRLVVTTGDGIVRVWDVDTQNPVTGRFVNEVVSSARFSADGRLLLTESGHSHFRVWEAETGIAVSPVLRQGAASQNATFSPDGRRVVTWGQVGRSWTARMWDLSPDLRPAHDLMAIAEFLSSQRIDGSGTLVPVEPGFGRSAGPGLQECVRNRHNRCGVLDGQKRGP
jgi:WD40 repeat protein